MCKVPAVDYLTRESDTLLWLIDHVFDYPLLLVVK